jgi:hypothetical protein
MNIEKHSDIEVTIYACGGAASNIVSDMEPGRQEDSPGFATLAPVYIDTSRSNMKGKNIPEDAVYLFEGLDGSGKVRSTNYEDISKQAKAILQKFKPKAFNIVVHSSAGGSGSVISNVLVSELKEKGHQVVIMIVGSTDTRIEIENTIKTLKSYESIANKRGSSIVVHYIENSKLTPRTVVNRQIKSAISLLMGLFSGQNAELDTADLKNWLDYTSISGTKPCLASLSLVTNPEDFKQAGTVISVATLAVGDMDTKLDQTPAYQCVGYAPDVWRVGAPNSLQLIGEHPIHFCISDDFIIGATTRLTKLLKEVDGVFASRVARDSLLSRDDNTTESGVVL